MDNYKKQILQRVIDFYIENSDADKKTIRTVACLMNDIEAINYTRCCKTLNLEVKPNFEEWLNTNFSKYNNEYYQDNGRNGIWKKHQLYELYEDTNI